MACLFSSCSSCRVTRDLILQIKYEFDQRYFYATFALQFREEEKVPRVESERKIAFIRPEKNSDIHYTHQIVSLHNITVYIIRHETVPLACCTSFLLDCVCIHLYLIGFIFVIPSEQRYGYTTTLLSKIVSGRAAGGLC